MELITIKDFIKKLQEFSPTATIWISIMGLQREAVPLIDIIEIDTLKAELDTNILNRLDGDNYSDYQDDPKFREIDLDEISDKIVLLKSALDL